VTIEHMMDDSNRTNTHLSLANIVASREILGEKNKGTAYMRMGGG
jgi:hypothetical protein